MAEDKELVDYGGISIEEVISEYKAIKDKHIFTDENTCEKVKSCPHPEFALIVAPPGAGKTKAIDLTVSKSESCQKYGNVRLDIDKFREFHPNFIDNHKRLGGSEKAVPYMQTFAQAISSFAEVEAMLQKINIVKETTGSSNEKSLALLRGVKQNGYETCVTFVVEPAEVSLKGIQERFEKQKNERPITARNVPQDYHDQSFNNQPKFLEVMARSGLVDKIILTNRNKEVLAISEQKDGHGHDVGYLVETMELNRQPKEKEATLLKANEMMGNIILKDLNIKDKDNSKDLGR